MKLAEALLLRADLKKKLLSLRERIGRNAMVQEGEVPKEKVEDLLAEATSALQEQQALVRRINAANETAKLSDGRLLADVLAQRETLVAQHSLLTSTIAATHKDVDRYSQREKANGRKKLFLTCLEQKVEMYKKFGLQDLGIADSTWGGEEWHEMVLKG